jgi:polar amino acid transport system substrate-binding protein
MRFYFSILIVCFSLANFCQAQEPIRACGGDSNWPPMSYAAGPTKEVRGLSVNILKAILTPEPRFALRPWARCMAEVEAHLGFDVMMSSFKTPTRENKFFFSRSYFSLTPSYFYAVKRYPIAPISTLSDLLKYRVCSLHGAATDYTKLPEGFIESGANNYTSLIRKIDRGHCEIVVDMREVLMGFASLGLLPFDSHEYKIVALPNTEKYPLHFATSKGHPRARELLQELDKGLMLLQKSGRLKQIIEQSIKELN